MDDGAAGVMIAPPASLRTDDQIFGYFQQAADIVGNRPFVLQDFPLATGVQISVPVIARIVDSVPTCVCLKHEDWPGLDKITTLRRPGQLSRRISILCGNGGVFLPEEMERGADGAMTGFAYPEMMVGAWSIARRVAIPNGRTTSSTPICRWRGSSSSRGWGSPSGNMC